MKLFSVVLEVPEDLDISAREPVIDELTGKQAFTTEIFPAHSYDKQVWNEETEGWETVTKDIPEETTTTLLWGDYIMGDDLHYQIDKLFSVWPAGIAPGTKIVEGKKVINAVFRSPTTDPVGLVEALTVVFDLAWVIMGLKSFDAPVPVYEGKEIVKYIAKLYVPLSGDVIPYINKIAEEQKPIYDDSEPPVITGYQPITQFPFPEYSGGSKW